MTPACDIFTERSGERILDINESRGQRTRFPGKEARLVSRGIYILYDVNGFLLDSGHTETGTDIVDDRVSCIGIVPETLSLLACLLHE